MNRRNFIRTGSLASVAIPAILFTPEQSQAMATRNTTFTEEFKDLDLTEETIDSLQLKMKSGQLSSQKICNWYLQRIHAIDNSSVKLNSVIELNPDALKIAETLDKERLAGKLRGVLHGIPILIKDNINTGDRMQTTAGSLALVGNKASNDAFIVKKLRDAGAVILGKTNLSEFANFRSTHSTSGWSSRGGQTKCPYVLDRNPSGSSAGTGSAISANLCTVGIGTETDGSIVSPSSINGLVGIKPTVGLWSRSGIIPISATQDTAGPMCRTVKDAAIVLSALTGIDPSDSITQQSDGKVHKDYTKFLDINGLKGKRLGIEKSFLAGNPDVVELLTHTLTQLKQNGVTVIEIDILKPINELAASELIVLQYEFKDGLNKYLATSNSKIRSLKEIIDFNSKNASRTMPYFKQETLINSNDKGGLDSKEYKEALIKSTSSRSIIDDMLKEHNLDAICGTTNGLACCIDLVNGDYDTGFSLSSPAAMAGYPHITVPMGVIHQLPIGFSFFSTAYREAELITMAYAFEQLTKQRKIPRFLKSI